MQSARFFGYKHWTVEEFPRCFYVGKGTKNRPFSLQRNHKWKNVIKRFGFTVEICVGPVTNDEVVVWEIATIKQEKTYSTNHSHNDDDINCNFTFGGDGSPGVKRPDLSERNRSNLGKPSKRKGCKLTEEQRKACGERSKGRIPWNKGKKCPYISECKTGKKRPDLSERNRANRGSKRSKSAIEKQIKSQTGKKRGPYKSKCTGHPPFEHRDDAGMREL